MLTGLGFSAFYAGGICLLANTAPVAFGSIGIPITTLATVTGLPLLRISAGVGRICAPVSLIVPSYLILVMGGWKALSGVLPAALLCGVIFGGTQFAISNFLGPELTDILASLGAMAALVLLLQFWKPRDQFRLPGDSPVPPRTVIPFSQALLAWSPFILLVICVLAWGMPSVKAHLDHTTVRFAWPGLHNMIQRMPPVTPRPVNYEAIYTFNWLSAAGTACLISALLSVIVLRMPLGAFFSVLAQTIRQLLFAEITIAAVLALAFLMNYSGLTATLGLAFAATGRLFPFFSAILGWLGVFLTGSDTSANALFGGLQVVTAEHLGMNPVLMASANSAGGVMGKMISLQSVAVASAATSMGGGEESRLFRFTLRHSILLAAIIGVIAVFYAYIAPSLAP
jgi:lactate permease